MPLEAGTAGNLFIAASLFILAATLLFAGRRRPEHLILTVFLGLVAVNYVAVGLAFHNLNDPSSPLLRIAYLALALDPVYLLLFVTMYPYVRRPPAVLTLLLVVAALGLVAAAFALTDLAPLLRNEVSLPRLALIGGLALGYFGAWVLAVRAAAAAPTPLLARRGGWLLFAVGVAVIPRLGLVPDELGVNALFQGLGVPAALLSQGMIVLAVMGLAYGAGLLVARGGTQRQRSEVTGVLRYLGLLLAGLAVAILALHALDIVARGGWRNLVPYGLRWVLFSAVLVFGLLAYDIVDARRAVDRIVPVVGAAVGAVGAFLGAWMYAEASGAGPGLAPLAGLGMALAVTVPAGVATRAAVRAVEARRGVGEGLGRRLELYRAALETAWAHGPPGRDARRQLERDRRAFGVGPEEARALEHVVVAALAPRQPRLAPGDEPATGLVLEGVLGEGAHGRVFKARRYPSGERVVVKEFHADRLGPEATRQRLLEELRPLQGLEHPNIVRLLDVHASGGRYFLVMEHVEGEPLSARLARGKMSEREVRRVVVDLLGALEATHAHGIVHRDVKPSNILLDRDGCARLTDFGVALVGGNRDAVRATVTNFDALKMMAGTLAYMAPEQALGRPATQQTDIYAVGLVTYEALTGRPALDVARRGLFEALEVAARPFIDLDATPAGWRAFLSRALAPDPAGRFPDARAMREALPR